MKIAPLALALAFAFTATAHAEGKNQVFYRLGKSTLANNRASQVFTDTNGAVGKNDGKTGTSIGAGLDIAMLPLGPGDLLGEIAATYTKYSNQLVRQTTSALLSGTNNSRVTVSALEVTIAPKYRLSFLDDKVRPWIIPLGLSYLVNSPPSNDTTYLDIGLATGFGVEYKFLPELSAGLGFRHTFAKKDVNIDTSYSAFDLYAGINF